jgi:hypothetical protein
MAAPVGNVQKLTSGYATTPVLIPDSHHHRTDPARLACAVQINLSSGTFWPAQSSKPLRPFLSAQE